MGVDISVDQRLFHREDGNIGKRRAEPFHSKANGGIWSPYAFQGRPDRGTPSTTENNWFTVFKSTPRVNLVGGPPMYYRAAWVPAHFGRLSALVRVVALTTLVYAELAILILFFPQTIGGYTELVCQGYILTYTLLVPGILVFALLDLELERNLLYLSLCIGVSFVATFVLGFAGNVLLALVGVNKPLLSSHLLILSTVIYMLLCGFVVRERNSYDPLSKPQITLRTSLLSAFTVMLTVLGGVFVFRYDSALVLGFVLVAIAMVPLLGASDVARKSTYPIAILVCSAVLIAQRVFSSPHLQGADIHFEFAYARRISREAFWAASDDLILSTLSSVVIHKVSSVDLVVVMKFVLPLTGVLLPVLLYYTYEKLTNSTTAFFATLLFMSLPRFFHIGPTNLKQTIAKFYIGLLLCSLILDTSESKRNFLLLIALSAISVAHYGTSYILLFLMLPPLVVIPLLKWTSLYRESRLKILTTGRYVFLLVMSVSWYLYTNGGEKGALLFLVPINALSNLSLGGGGDKSTLHYATLNVPATLNAYRALVVAAAALVGFGFLYISLTILANRLGYRDSAPVAFTDEYLLISISCFGLLAASLVLPSAVGAGTIGFARVFHLVLIWIAVYFLYGFIAIARAGRCIGLRFPSKETMCAGARYGAALLLLSSLAISTGLAPEIVQRTAGGDYTPGSAIGHPRIESEGTIREKTIYYGQNYPETDVVTAAWLGKYGTRETISVDHPNAHHVLISYGGVSADAPMQYLVPGTDVPRQDMAYVFLRTMNYKDGLMQTTGAVTEYDRRTWPAAPLAARLNATRNKLYTTGDTAVYG